MPKISIEDLKRIKEEQTGKMVLRGGQYRAKVTVHMGTCGIAAGAREVMNVFRELIADKEIQDVILTNSGCAGLCAKEPMITVEVINSAPVKYVQVDREKARKIFEEHVLGGKVVEDFALAIGSETMAV